jgi:GTP cyclohydrolase II
MSQTPKSSTSSASTTLKQIADVKFPTRWAEFRLLGFEALRTDRNTGSECKDTALALLLGDVYSLPPIVRIHSQCTTGEVFHSLRCDCHDQLHLALRAIAEERAGVLVYERQEGRGIGLMEKLRAYELQDQGFDTVEANLQLGHAADSRDYLLAVQVLRYLKIRSLRLISNNPEKVKAIANSGIDIVERISADVPHSMHSVHYLATKRKKLGHLSNPAGGTFPRNPEAVRVESGPELCGNSARAGVAIGVELRGDR